MQSKIFVSAVVLLVVGAGLAASLAVGQGGKGAAANAALQFAGKVIVVSSSLGDSEFVTALEKVELKRIADNNYLVGKSVDDARPESWNRGQTVWVALDDISEITEFADAESYKKTRPRPAAK